MLNPARVKTGIVNITTGIVPKARKIRKTGTFPFELPGHSSRYFSVTTQVPSQASGGFSRRWSTRAANIA